MKTRKSACLCLLSLLAGLAAQGQEVTGSIYGSVVDESGAAVPGARVIVTHTERDIVVRELLTNGAGLYSATLLAVGQYDVAVEAPGFKRAEQRRIEVNANDRAAANFAMEIGDIAQEISVDAAAVRVETLTAQQQSLATGSMVRELALNNRHFAQLLALQPGVVSGTSDSMSVGTTNPTGGNNLVSFSINGQRNSANNFTVDGADITDRGSNLTIINYPSVDAIEEVRVVRSAYSAEFGRTAGGQVSVITRSGTGEFHGSLYEFFRNDQLNANAFFNNASQIERPPLRYNNFGYTLGGPLYLPGLYNKQRNKSFFFWSQEFRRVINYATAQATVPTSLEKQGIFAVPVCIGPLGNECSQTTQRITNIHPVAQAYIQDIWSQIPEPNAPSNQLFTPLRGIFNARQDLIRIDQHVGSRLLIAARFLNDSIPTTEPRGLFTNGALPDVHTTRTNAPGRTLVIRATSTLAPTVYNEAGFTWSSGAIESQPVGLMASERSPDVARLIKLPYPTSLARIPSVNAGFSALTSFGPYENTSRNWNVFGNTSVLRGRHNLKFGGTWNRYGKRENAATNNAGTFTFANAPRVIPAQQAFLQAWANFLTGNVATFTQAIADVTPDLKMHGIEFYGQDDWRITNRFILNVGLRWSDFLQPFDTGNLLSNFDPSLFNPALAPRIDPANGNIIPGTGDPLNGLVYDRDNVPEGGIASASGSQVAPHDHQNWAPRIGFAWDLFGNGKTSIRSGYGIFFDTQLIGIYQQNIFTNPPYSTTSTFSGGHFDDPSSGTPVVSAAPVALRGTPIPYNTPYSQQWSFDIQQQIAREFIVTAAYVGTKGTNLLGAVDINQVRPGLAAEAGLIPPSGYVTAGLASARLNVLRPYLGYNAINVIRSWFNSNYHSLQMTAQKRFAGTSMISASYTWSKALTDSGSDRSNAPQNTYNRKAEYGRSPLDRAHVLNVAYVYELPFLREQRGFTGHLLGGWQLSGITSWVTGAPLTVTSATGQDPAGIGFLGPSAAGPRPDLVSDPTEGNGLKTVESWFNTAAFREPASGTVGNSGRGILRAPGLQRWDISIFKNIRLKEEVRLQVRGEAFNAFNHTNFDGVSTAFGSVTFGRLTSTRDPRNLQLALKLNF